MSWIGAPLEIAFAFVLMLGVLITVHEFGHFFVAKLCGVRVLKFSIGFGPPIGIGRFRLAWTRGGTDYVISWFPLGGFVKMLGENPDEVESPEALADASQSLGAKPTWQKLAIIFAGPAMNLILPIFVFAGILWVGIERAAPVVGTVEPGSPAAAAGMLAGDRILALDGEPVGWWDDFEREVRESPGRRVTLAVGRGQQELSLPLEIEDRPGLDIFRLQKNVGWLGLQHPRQKALLGVTDSQSPAARAGLLSGDRVTAVDDRAVGDWTTFSQAYADASNPVTFTLARQKGGQAAQAPEEETEEEEHTLVVPALGSTEALGVLPAVVLVAAISDGMPAERAGLAVGDLIIAVDGKPVGSFVTFRETVLASGGRALEVQVARAGETRTVSLAPERSPSPTGMEDEVFLIGIQGANALLMGDLATDRVRSPLVSIPRAVRMTTDLTVLYLGGLKRIVSGEISRRNIGGPIEIAKQSHRALQAGWDRFLNLLVLISINLGIVNLLPIPILDGGQALMFAVEGIKRSPLSVRTREMVQQVGLVFLVTLMGFAFWNDVTRHWSSFVEWVKGLS
jgi:regulator of sigma E protease